MKFGVFLPISGRAAGPDTLMEAARSAEAQGFDAVWSADRVVTPWQIHTSYPYSENHELDRKSTRLNSSHTVISYAVFCLKKKKKAQKKRYGQIQGKRSINEKQEKTGGRCAPGAYEIRAAAIGRV